jgi:hypothetical protein
MSRGNRRARIRSALPQSSEIGAADLYVAFVPTTALSRHLLDHLVGAQENACGKLNPDFSGGLEVDHQFEFRS